MVFVVVLYVFYCECRHEFFLFKIAKLTQIKFEASVHLDPFSILTTSCTTTSCITVSYTPFVVLVEHSCLL